MVGWDAVPAGRPRKPALGRRRELSGGHYEPPARSWLTARAKAQTLGSDRKAQPDDWQNAAAERREARSRESESTLPTTGASLGAPPPLIEGRERSEGAPGADQTIWAAERWLNAAQAVWQFASAVAPLAPTLPWRGRVGEHCEAM